MDLEKITTAEDIFAKYKYGGFENFSRKNFVQCELLLWVATFWDRNLSSKILRSE